MQTQVTQTPRYNPAIAAGLSKRMAEATIPYAPFSYKQKKYILGALGSKMTVAEGAVRCSKTVMHCLIFALLLEISPDKIHLASGSSQPNAKLNIGDCNGFGLEYLFRGRCRWGKYKDNEALFVNTKKGQKIVIFAGGGKADSYKKILGNSYGIWMATEINEHYDCDDSKTSFIKVAMARQIAARDPRIIWDLNPSNPRASIYTDYIDKYRYDGLLGGYNYEHFTIADNNAISEERKQEIISQYGDQSSAWYRRDILGERCTCEGLCYQILADKYNDFIIAELPEVPVKMVVGIDFGGNGSAHSFTCTLFGRGYRWICVGKARRVEAKGLDPTALDDKFEEFINDCRAKFKWNDKAIEVRCDSAEQTLINGFITRNAKHHLGCIIKNACKSAINDRIKLILKLAGKGYLYWLEDAKTSLDAMSSCVYDIRPGHEDERLDNGTTDIDDVDSTEYTIEPDMQNLLRVIETSILPLKVDKLKGVRV